MGKFQSQDGEHERIKKDAYRHEMNISEYLRWLIDNQRKEDGNAKNNCK